MSWKFELLMKPSAVPMPKRNSLEGPVWDGEHLYFTHIPGSRILRLEPKTGEITEWRTGTKQTNGLAFDAKGQLYGCSAGGRAILRFDRNGENVVVADRCEKKKLNAPNDLAVDLKGRIWFTNPWSKSNISADERMELDHESVMRADPQPDGTYSVTRVTFDTTHPNGILVSQDQNTLYVAESGFVRGVMRQLRAYPIHADGSLGTFKTLFTWGEDAQGVHRGIDGMCLDADGNIIACTGSEVSGAGPLIYVFAPNGRVLETHLVPNNHPTNCCFGGPDMTTLYVTTGQNLYRAQTNRVGWAMYP